MFPNNKKKKYEILKTKKSDHEGFKGFWINLIKFN